MSDRRIDLPAIATSAGLAAAAGVHLAWARGSTWPRATADELADLVVGRRPMPSPAASAAVGAALTGAAAAVLVAGHSAPDGAIGRTARFASRVAGAVLRARGFGGLALARVGSSTSGEATEEFRRMDQQLYSPLCLALGAGARRAGRTPTG